MDQGRRDKENGSVAKDQKNDRVEEEAEVAAEVEAEDDGKIGRQ